MLAALLRLPQRALWRRVVAAGRAVLPTLGKDLVALLPEALRDALALVALLGDEREETAALVA